MKTKKNNKEEPELTEEDLAVFFPICKTRSEEEAGDQKPSTLRMN